MVKSKKKRISKKESLLAERIHFLSMSIALLEHGRKPFHTEAIALIRQKIIELKKQK